MMTHSIRDRRHEAIGLSDQDILNMYETMLLARRIDERMWLLNRAGKIPFVVSCQGQEAAQVGAAYALNHAKDYLLPSYRDLAMVLSFGMSARDVMLNIFAKADDPNSGGRQMPAHYGDRSKRIVTHSSPVTTQVPHAAGIAQAGQIKGDEFATLVSFGEGSSNQGDFHEGANFAGVRQLPVILFCENNQYAISVPYNKQVACQRLSDRAIGYGMHGETVDGNDPLAVYEAVKHAHDRAMNGEGPSLIEALVYRMTPHSSDDNDLDYRTKEEVDKAKENDGFVTFRDYLKAHNVLDDETEQQLEAKVRSIIDDATRFAENAADPDVSTVLDHVYDNEGVNNRENDIH